MSRIIDEFVCWIDHVIAYLPGRIGIVSRRSWLKFLGLEGEKFSAAAGCTFISPQSIKLGEGVSIGNKSLFTADQGSIAVGRNTTFNSNVHINASVGGAIEFGESCLIGPNVVMRTAGHRFDNPGLPIRKQGHISKNIILGDDIWVGSNVVILGGVEIGKGAIIGAGAVVTKNVPPMALAVGVPAEVIKFRGS